MKASFLATIMTLGVAEQSTLSPAPPRVTDFDDDALQPSSVGDSLFNFFDETSPSAPIVNLPRAFQANEDDAGPSPTQAILHISYLPNICTFHYAGHRGKSIGYLWRVYSKSKGDYT